jgi:hypothetical protein
MPALLREKSTGLQARAAIGSDLNVTAEDKSCGASRAIQHDASVTRLAAGAIASVANARAPPLNLSQTPGPAARRSRPEFRGVEFALDQGSLSQDAYTSAPRTLEACARQRPSGLHITLGSRLLRLSGRRAGGSPRCAASIWSNDDGRILELDYLGVDYWRAGPRVCRDEHAKIADGGCRSVGRNTGEDDLL